MISDKAFKFGAIFIAGATVGAVVIGYFAYLKKQRKQADDADEGIGDVDSIISEGEVEEAALARIPTGTRVSTSEDTTEQSKGVVVKITRPTITNEGQHRKVNENGLKCVKILVLGLDGCGKTSMLNLLASKTSDEPYQPTTGFNAVQVGREDLELNIVEVGGNKTTRSYWKNFTSDSDLLVYVVDGADSSRYQKAKTALKNLLDGAAFKNIACLLVSNKQDLKESRKIDKIFSDIDIKEIAKKGVSTITLLNTICVLKKEGTTYKEAIMDVIMDIVRKTVK